MPARPLGQGQRHRGPGRGTRRPEPVRAAVGRCMAAFVSCSYSILPEWRAGAGRRCRGRWARLAPLACRAALCCRGCRCADVRSKACWQFKMAGVHCVRMLRQAATLLTRVCEAGTAQAGLASRPGAHLGACGPETQHPAHGAALADSCAPVPRGWGPQPPLPCVLQGRVGSEFGLEPQPPCPADPPPRLCGLRSHRRGRAPASAAARGGPTGARPAGPAAWRRAPVTLW
jgi:hypothetical protein